MCITIPIHLADTSGAVKKFARARSRKVHRGGAEDAEGRTKNEVSEHPEDRRAEGRQDRTKGPLWIGAIAQLATTALFHSSASCASSAVSLRGESIVVTQ